MTDAIIRYTSGAPYHLVTDFHVDIPIIGHAVRTEFITLTGDGQLTLHRGFHWDGASGPTFNTRNTQRASAAHDALYKLIRLGLIPDGYREIADHIMHKLLLADGMTRIRAGLWLWAVRRAAGGAARPSRERPILVAP